MAVSIQELVTEVRSSPGITGESEGQPDSRDERLQQSLFALLELKQERKARLVID